MPPGRMGLDPSDGEEMMTPEAICLVRITFAQLLPVADLAADLFDDHLFSLDPALRGRFAANLDAQKQALMASLGLVIG